VSRINKKCLTAILAFCLCAALLAGCSDSPAESPQTAKETAASPKAETAQTDRKAEASPDIESLKAEWAVQKIRDYTKYSFRFVEHLKIDRQQDGYQINLRFVPEAGSAPVKEEIYRSMAQYAWSIHRFFPEVHRYEFHVLWDEHNKSDVIQAIIDEEGVKQLDNRYFNLEMTERGQLETSWRSIFTTITESDEAQKWHNRTSGV